MRMHKIPHLLSCSLLLSSFLLFAAEVPHIDVEKLLVQKQEEHRAVIFKNGNLLDVYEKNLEELSKCTGKGDSEFNEFFGAIQHAHEQLAAARKDFNDTSNEVVLLLNADASLIKRGLLISKMDPEIELKVKTTADCLSRLVMRNFPAQIINWSDTYPMRARNEKELSEHRGDVAYTKQSILKGRNLDKAVHGWWSIYTGALASLCAYFAIKKPSFLTRVLTAGLALYAGYNGATYLYLKNLPAPSNIDAYKRMAGWLKPKFE